MTIIPNKLDYDLAVLNDLDQICHRDVVDRFVDFVLLGRLSQDDDGCFYGRTPGFFTLQLVNRNRGVCI